MDTDKPKVEVKNVKHVYTKDELVQLGRDLAQANNGLRAIENELQQVKSQYKAKIDEATAKIDRLTTTTVDGFDRRDEHCVVIFEPKQRKKNFYLERDWDKVGRKSDIVLTEEMTKEDYELDLFQAESKFENKAEIALFKELNNDKGTLIVGKQGKMWFCAIRAKIGKQEMLERLDSEQKSFKERADAVSTGVDRFKDWAKKNLKDGAKGFESDLKAVVEANKEKVE